jgi:hypothetical protein
MPSFFEDQPLGVAAEAQDRRPDPPVKLLSDAFFISEVVDNIAHFGIMKVAAANNTVVIGVPMSRAGNSVIGPRQIGSCYPAHTKVICYQPNGVPYCYVLGSIPEWITSSEFNRVPDWLVPACRSGIGFDRVHSGSLERVNGISGDINFSAGSPCDELPGDCGYINDLGVGYGIGRLMAWLRASHFCGIEAFWLDNLLRLTGYNLEIQTAASDLRALNDEGEWSEVFRYGHLPWETVGVFGSSEDFTKHAADSWNGTPGRAGREPIEDDQMGIWRAQRFRGYLGDLERVIIALPVRGEASGETQVEQLQNETVFPGVAETGIHTDGRIRLRSAKGILIEKTVAIPVPKELILPEDPLGDSKKNYKAAGVLGDGEKLHTKHDPTLPDDQAGLRALMAYERHALLYGYYDNIGFIRHEKDWLLPEEREAVEQFGLSKAIYDPVTEVQDLPFWMPLPKKVTLQVDHRGSTQYFSGKASFAIEDDGSIVLEDAYGSQIRMEGGNIFLSARNDVVLQPGRNVQAWAPHDLILKAGNSADLSASQGDVRIKAQGNLMMVAVDKGVLIESQFDPAAGESEEPDWSQLGENVESRGVLIKALASNVISMSKHTYLRAGTREQDRSSGQIHVDAGGGLGLAFVHGQDITLRAQNRLQAIIGSTGENDDTASLDLRKHAFVLGGRALQSMTFGANVFSFGHEEQENTVFSVLGTLFVARDFLTAGSAEIGSTIQGGGMLVLQNSLLVRGSGVFTGGLLYQVTEDRATVPMGAPSDGTFPVIEEHPTRAKEHLDSMQLITQRVLEAERAADNALVEVLTTELYDATSQLAGEMLISDAVFSFRTPEQYGTDQNFVWYEARWQEMNRKLFSKTTPWVEVPLLAPSVGQETMPYPGFEIWEEEDAFVTLENKLFDFTMGVSDARTQIEDDEDEPELGKTTRKTFKEGYNVTVQQRS